MDGWIDEYKVWFCMNNKAIEFGAGRII